MDARAPIRALLVEDNPGDARLIREMVREARGGRVQVAHAERLASAIERLADPEAVLEVVLLDLSLPDSQGFETFTRLRAAAPLVPIVVLSGLDDETVALRAVQAGAQDYLVKGHVDGDTLVRALRYAIERKRLEEAQRAVERQKDEFVSSVSHDLRTPIAAIKASVGVLLAAPPAGLSPPQQRLLTNVGLAADELARLVEDLLDTSRIQAGRVELFRTTVDLRDLARRAARSVEPLAQARRQTLELALPAEPVPAQVDAERVVRVLVNLLGNANKHGRAGGRIRLALERADGLTARLSVADDGPGIAPEEAERIFQRFYRAPAGGDKPRGTGLGLAIVRALVELHGGRVWAEPRDPEGRGATFVVSLPLGALAAFPSGADPVG